MLDAIQGAAFRYFAHETNPANGLVTDLGSGAAPARIATVAFALTAYPVPPGGPHVVLETVAPSRARGR